jgi:sulfur-carrier protein
MAIIMRVPGSLAAWFGGQESTSCSGETLGQCIEDLESRFPGLRKRVVDDKGGTSAVLIFVNGENIIRLEGLGTSIRDGDEIAVIPLAAGG